jgi:hypothetical protein
MMSRYWHTLELDLDKETTAVAAESVVELMGRVDEHAVNESPNALQNALAVYEGIRDGDSSGSALVDMVIMRSGLYLPDVAARYKEAEEAIAEKVGEIAVVVETTEIQDRDRMDERWLPHRPLVKILAGRIIAPELVVDVAAGTWAIPTEQYFTPYMGEPNIAGDGPMPVNDRLISPATPSLNSTLGKERMTETTTRPSPDHVPYQIPYRVFGRTELHVGQEAIDEAIHSVIALIPSDEDLAAGRIGRHVDTGIWL